MFLGILFQCGSAVHVPLAPGGDDLDRRVEVVISDFEAYLVVAFAGGAVGDGVGAFLGGDLHLGLGNQRPGDRGAEEITTLVDGVGAEHRENEVAGELLAQVEDVAALAPVFLAFAGMPSSSSP